MSKIQLHITEEQKNMRDQLEESILLKKKFNFHFQK